jgi:hypothetical protein
MILRQRSIFATSPPSPTIWRYYYSFREERRRERFLQSTTDQAEAPDPPEHNYGRERFLLFLSRLHQ